MSPSARLPQALFAIGLVACVGLFLLQTLHYFPHTIDDSFITFRYARNWMAGEGLTFNPGERPTEGFTNPSWLVLSAASLAAGVDPMLTTKIAGILCGVLLLLLVTFGAGVLRGKHDGWNLLAPLFLAGQPSFAFWAVQGMETPLNTLLIFACWLSAWRLPQATRWERFGFPALITLAVATRIDAVYYLSPIPLLWFFQCPPGTGKGESIFRHLLVPVCLAAAGVLFLQAFRMVYFGELLPNTYFAKQPSAFAEERGVWQLLHFFFFHGVEQGANGDGDLPWGQLLHANVMLGALGAVALWGSWRVRIFHLVPVGMLIFFQLKTNGDWMPGFRFFQFLLPFLATAVAVAIGDTVVRFSPRGVVAARVFGCCCSAVVVLLSGVQQRTETVYIFSRDAMWFEREARWFHPSVLHGRLYEGWGVALGPISARFVQEVPAGGSLFLSDIGLPGWVLPTETLIDVDGLTNRELAHAPSIRIPELDAASHRRAYVELLMAETPPDLLLAFEQHLGKGPDVPGYVYPEPVAIAVQQPRFAEYSEVWRTLKTGNDVWNHLYRREGVEAPTPAEMLARYEKALRLSPRLGFLLPPYVELAEAEGESPWDEPWFVRAVRANSANREVVFALLDASIRLKRPQVALLLEEITHPTLRTSLFEGMLRTAYLEGNLPEEAERLGRE
ncbi:MAG: hypothetical protein SFY68_10770 [Candidatus Sumerlaeia bacterium]|nr:hypothetical protein [Candidatus Sumerlaeia bacterium]